MPTKPKLFNFDATYLSLPNKFYAKINPPKIPNPEFVILNDFLLEKLSIDNSSDLLHLLSGNVVEDDSMPFSQAYAGHQFGHFTLLGDGRAIVLGEYLTPTGSRFDIQLKGAGRTPFSRNGDGKATLKAMLREYLISEAMHHLKIPTSRSLAVIKTDEPVYRERIYQGAILTRLMSSHIRVGTFQFASYFGTKEELQKLTNYTIKRHFPTIEKAENLAIELLKKVMEVQVNLVVSWLRVGFIHGVMNTDNTSICGESFDYGPCAFLNSYNPNQVYSSIDTQGRYAFGNQAKIIKWNLIRLAEALLPIIDENQEKAIEMAHHTVHLFDDLWKNAYQKMMRDKLGIQIKATEDEELVNELLQMMERNQLDYTLTFASITYQTKEIEIPTVLNNWFEKWKKRTSIEPNWVEKMKEANPVFIPRNHLVEKALENAQNGNLELFNQLLEVGKNPYKYNVAFHSFLLPPNTEFESNYQTFCGT